MKRACLFACLSILVAGVVIGCGSSDSAEAKPDPNVKGRSINSIPHMGAGGGGASTGAKPSSE